MAFEKECDIVLRQLNETMKSYNVKALDAQLKRKGCMLTENEFISLLTILKHNGHVLIDSPISAVVENKKVTYFGSVSISEKGCAFIANKSYEAEKSQNDLLLSITLSNGKIQSSLLHINRWIAFGGIAVAVSSILEIVRNYYPRVLSFFVY